MNLSNFQKLLKPFNKFGKGTCNRRIMRASKGLNFRNIKSKRVVIVGSDGKGSHVSALEGVCISQEKTVFSFTSPHFIKFEERFRFNGEPLSQPFLCKCFLEVIAFLNIHDDINIFGKFELLYLTSIVVLNKIQPDIAIIESGIGGEFDPSRSFLPHTAILTSVSLEHTEILGNSVKAIADDKIRVCHKNTVIVLSIELYNNLLSEKVSFKNNKISTSTLPPYFNNSDNYNNYNIFTQIAFSNSIVAYEEIYNTKLIPDTCMISNINKPLGRYQWIKDNCLIDAAHTTDGFDKVIDIISCDKNISFYKDITFIISVSENRNLDFLLKKISLLNSKFNIHFICSSFEKISQTRISIESKIRELKISNNIKSLSIEETTKEINNNLEACYISLGSLYYNAELYGLLLNFKVDDYGLL